MYDALSARDVFQDELSQRIESGFDVSSFEEAYRQIPADDTGAVWSLTDEFSRTSRLPGWAYSEPEGIDDIKGSLPDDTLARESGRFGDDELSTMILGAWQGRIAGCMLGKPIEDGAHWTRAHIREYLESQHAYPIRDYIPRPDQVADRYVFREFWPTTTLGRVHGGTRDDDIDYTVLALHTLSKYGPDYRAQDMATEWMSLLPLLQTYTGERAALRNLVTGIKPPESASFRNPYREWIGARIRADMYGWTNPGQPRAAALGSLADASISSTGNGIYAAMWAAALCAGAFVADSAEAAVRQSMEHIPPGSRLAEAISRAVAWYDAGMEWDAAMDEFEACYGGQNWFHSINNSAVVAMGLLWGGDDFSAAVGLTVQAGLDTDSNGALAGSVAGILARGRIPGNWVDPLEDTISTMIFGYDHSSIRSLAERTMAVIQHRDI